MIAVYVCTFQVQYTYIYVLYYFVLLLICCFIGTADISLCSIFLYSIVVVMPARMHAHVACAAAC